MKQKVLLYMIIGYFVFVSFSHATLDDNLQGCWDFDNDLNDTFDERDGSPNGAPSFSSSVKVAGSHSLYLNDACNVEFADLTGTDYDFDQNYTLCVWSYMETHASTDYLFTQFEDGSNVAEILKHTDGTGFGFYQYSNPYVGNFPLDFGGEVTTSGWDMLCFGINGSNNYYLFKNTTGMYATGTAIDKYVAPLTLGGNNANYYWDGYVDTFARWNRTLTAEEITQLWNSGSGMTCTDIQNQAGGVDPSLSLNTNIVNNSAYGMLAYTEAIYNFSVNGTITNNSLIYNGSLYINGTLNQTFLNVDLSTNTQINYSFEEFEGDLEILIDFYNINASNNVTYYLYLDGINPDVSISGYENNTMFYRNITASLSFGSYSSDTNLFAINHSLFYPNGSVFYNSYVENITETYYNDASAPSLPELDQNGQYTQRIEAWDDHNPTPKPHEKADKIDKEKDKLKFYFEKGEIEITSQDTESFEIYEENNKYKIEYEFKKLGENTLLLYDPYDHWSYRIGSDHKAHLGNARLNKYYDQDSPDLDILATYKEEDYWIIIVYAHKLKIKTNSIGDLNYNVLDRVFNITDPFYIFAYDINTNDSILEFEVYAYNGSISQYGEATYGYAGINITSGNYSINITSDIYQYSDVNNTAFSQNGNYSFYLTPSNAVYVYFYDEITKELINDRTVEFRLISDNFANNYSTTSGYKAVVATAGNYDIVFSAENYTERFDYFELQNDTANLTLYLLEEDTDDTVSMYVYDEVSNPVEDAFIYVYRYDIDSNSDVLVVTRRTNFEGKADVNLELNGEYYKFKIYYLDELKYETERSYISSSSLTWTINTQDPILQDYYNLGDCTGYVAFDIDTFNFIFNYQDPTNTHVTQGCLEIYRVNIQGETLYNETCVSSSGATIYIGVTNVSGVRYVGRGYVTLDGTEYLFDEYSHQFQTIEEDFGSFGIFITLILTILVGLIALYDIATGLILLGFPTMLTAGLGIIDLGFQYALGLEVIFVILALLIKK